MSYIDYVKTFLRCFFGNASMSIPCKSYHELNPHELSAFYNKLEILRPVMIPDPWQRKQFRALDICQVCDGDRLQVVSKSYGYGPILPPDDDLEDWPKYVLRNRKNVS
ncbi:hypothetical protein E0G74_01385 [Salmonella enterica]|nr:hypothetical protein [Salmonella enterica]EGD6457191.1 hypothetical protein [Salmonella enterica]